MSLPLSSPFRGETGKHMRVYRVGDNTGTYEISFSPVVPGDYAITVMKSPVWAVQLVQTVGDGTGVGLFGEQNTTTAI